MPMPMPMPMPMTYTDIVYSEENAVATIAINRPEVMNAFRGQTVEELLHALMPDFRKFG